jgi:hypothetical protein
MPNCAKSIYEDHTNRCDKNCTSRGFWLQPEYGENADAQPEHDRNADFCGDAHIVRLS